MFESGVKYYTMALLAKPIAFPEEHVCCWYCMLFNKHTEECRVTNETVYRPKEYVGGSCPLRLMEGVKNGQ